LPKERWELVLVDNLSTEPLARRVDVSWHTSGRIVREEKLGLAAARIRGIEETGAGVIIFVDDDNVLRQDYLDQVARIGHDWPQLGVWGGSMLPEFELPPPAYLKSHLKSLALREVTKPLWSNVWNCRDAEPWGAGLCLRRAAAEAYRDHYAGTKLRIGDRVGKSLLSGGDTEIVYVTCSLGMGMGVFPELSLTHLIPKQRLEEAYLVKIAEGISTSSMVLNYKWGGTIPASPFSAVVLARMLKHILFGGATQRRFALASFRARVAARRVIAQTRKACDLPPTSNAIAAERQRNERDKNSPTMA